MDYTVGIPVRNEESTLAECVDSILAQSVLPNQVLICLNGSNKATYEVAERLERQIPLVELCYSSPGKVNAWNRIVSIRDNDIILFTDGDVTLPKNSAERLIEALDKNAEACVSGGNLFYKTPPIQNFWSVVLKNKLEQEYHVKNLSGANYMINYPKLRGLATNMGISLLPPGVINEDALIGAIARVNNSFAKADTYAEIIPTTTLREYFELNKRLRRGYQQLENLFPELFFDGQTAGVDSSIDYRSDIIKNRGLTYRTIKATVGGLANLYASLSKPQDVKWKELKSTKQSSIRV